MSFIRCLNNPDGAYVWHDVNGKVIFTTHEEKWFSVPSYLFYGLVRQFIRKGYQDAKYGDFSIKESDDFHKYSLTYQNKSIKLWQVTWRYIVEHAKFSLMSKKDRKTILRIENKI